jgi:hypothetical protein
MTGFPLCTSGVNIFCWVNRDSTTLVAVAETSKELKIPSSAKGIKFHQAKPLATPFYACYAEVLLAREIS